MLDPLAFKAASHVVLGILGLTGLILAAISVWKEAISEKSLRGLFPFAIFVLALFGFISLLTAYVQFQRPVSVLPKLERAALTLKE